MGTLLNHVLNYNNQNGFTIKEREEGSGGGMMIGHTKKRG
jgi:hypothetical protein